MYTVAGRVAHHAVACHSAHTLGTSFHHLVSSTCNCTSGVHHVINNHNVLTFHITNNLDGIHHVCLQTHFVAEYQWSIQLLGKQTCTLGTTHIRCSDDKVWQMEILHIGNFHE